MYPSCRHRFSDDVVVDGIRIYFVVDVVASFGLTRVSFLPVVVFRRNLRCRRLWVGLLKCRRLCRE